MNFLAMSDDKQIRGFSYVPFATVGGLKYHIWTANFADYIIDKFGSRYTVRCTGMYHKSNYVLHSTTWHTETLEQAANTIRSFALTEFFDNEWGNT